jgi:hypothetical protein
MRTALIFYRARPAQRLKENAIPAQRLPILAHSGELRPVGACVGKFEQFRGNFI